MSWIILLASGVLEAIWATALGASKGFTKLVPSIVFLVALALSMGGLALAMREIPTGTAYAVWVGVGASLTIVWAMITGAETATVIKLLLVLGIVACVVALKLVSDAEH